MNVLLAMGPGEKRRMKTYLELLCESNGQQGGTIHQFCICDKVKGKSLMWICPAHDGFVDKSGNFMNEEGLK